MIMVEVRGLGPEQADGIASLLMVMTAYCAENFPGFQKYAIDMAQEPPGDAGLVGLFANLTPGMLAELLRRMEVTP